MPLLRIRNSDGSINDICKIKVVPPNFAGKEVEKDLIVDSFTRDEGLLNGKKIKLKLRFLAFGKDDLSRLKDFAGFLGVRKKAGVISFKMPDDDDQRIIELYLLPPQEGRDIEQTGISVATKINIQPKQCAARSTGTGTGTGGVVIAQIPPPLPSAPQQRKKEEKEKVGFLSNLLSRVGQSSKEIASFSTYKPIVLDNTKTLEDLVRKEILRFDDPEITIIPFEPMEKHLRYFIHDFISDIDDLVGISTGDDDDRHVVIYRKGHEPEEENIVVDPGVMRMQKQKGAYCKKTSKETKIEEKFLNDAKNDVQAINKDKRDRRTIEEIQQEIKRRKVSSESH